MKELSIEEKAKRYDEAIKKAKYYYDEGKTLGYAIDIVSDIFHELNESEDEKIRKWLICTLKSLNNSTVQIDGAYEMMLPAIAWLENQGEEIIPLEQIILNVWEIGNYWKELTKGFCNTEYGTQLDYIVKHWKEGEHYIKSLKKQGEQKPVDKVKTKFHEGDWVVYDHRLYQVVELPKEGYINLGLKGNGKIEFAPSTYCRHWTIQDAKDGDVLADKYGNIGYFKDIRGICWHSYFYLGNNSTLYGVNIGGSHEQYNTYPATKEQREQLEKAITDAGYVWDADKKELKEIEQKSAWSKEDDSMVEDIIEAIDTRYASSDYKEMVNWLRDIKGRVQPKQEWSKEDEAALGDALWCCKQAASIAKDENDMGNVWYAEHWLKSLSPQNTWKPSDLPHWEKSTLPNDNTTGFNSDYFCYKGYNINYKELFEKLPKDD